MSMKDFLAQHYGTGAQPSPETFEKQAQMQIFAKLAADNNVDLQKLSEEQIAHLWNETFKAEEPPTTTKTAEEEKAEHEKEEHEKKEKAKEEHEKKKEAAAKTAEADFLGRQMAHAMVDELKKLAAAGEMPGGTAAPTAAAAAATDVEKAAAAELEKAAKGMPEGLKKGLERVGHHFEATGKGAVKAVGRTGGAEKAMHPGTAKAIGAAVHGAGAAAAAGGAAAAHHAFKKKESSAVDQLAASVAVEKAAEAGFNPEEAGDRIVAVLTLGAPESEKIAHVTDLEAAVGVRALELLELAGYPVTWNA